MPAFPEAVPSFTEPAVTNGGALDEATEALVPLEVCESVEFFRKVDSSGFDVTSSSLLVPSSSGTSVSDFGEGSLVASSAAEEIQGRNQIRLPREFFGRKVCTERYIDRLLFGEKNQGKTKNRASVNHTV